MLFDLQGKRKRLVQVTYAGLALLMGGGLVLFGIGSSGTGGILDAVGLGSNSNNSRGADYDKQAAKIQAQLTANPANDKLLLQLARTRILAGNTKSTVDSATGQATYSADALAEFQQAADAWEKYLKTKPKPADTKSAILIAQAYVALAQNQTSIVTAIDDIKGAANAQKLYADANPSLGTLSQLALYQYLAGQIPAGDKTAKAAIKLATAANREQLKTRLKQAKTQGLQLKKELKKAEKQQGNKQQLQNPLGGLGGGGSGLGGGLPGASGTP
jgi:hypothetical protein